MTNPWLVTIESGAASAAERAFPSKRAAAAFAKQWVQEHPEDRLLVVSRKDGRPRLQVSLEGGEVQCRPYSHGKPQSPESDCAERLDQVIRQLGYSRARAKQVRKAIFAAWTAALQRGETVETPIGGMFVAPPRRERRRIDPLEPKRDGKWKIQRVFQRHPKRVRLRPNRKILPNPKSIPVPPPPIKRGPAIVINPFWGYSRGRGFRG